MFLRVWFYFCSFIFFYVRGRGNNTHSVTVINVRRLISFQQVVSGDPIHAVSLGSSLALLSDLLDSDHDFEWC